MKLRVVMLVILFALMVSFTGESKAADVPGGWTVCDMVRIGVNAEHGFAYLELRSPVWNNQPKIFYIDESIRKESIAVALTALSLGEPVRVLIRADKNPRGYQVLKAVYTYTP